MKKHRVVDLTEGPITKNLIKLSLPIMGTSFIQMGYNLTDMILIGKKGSDAVAAVGTAGFFTWFAAAIILLSKAGAQIKVAQSIGMKDQEETKNYIRTSIQLNIILSLIYMAFIWIFHNQLIGFFRLGSEEVINFTREYLLIVSCGFICYCINPLFTAILTASGDSKTPFIINAIALVTNVVLDCILIFGVGSIPALNVAGAAIATVTAQVVGTISFLIVIIKRRDVRFKQNYFSKLDLKYVKAMTKLGAPVALQEGLFSVFSMTLARLIAPFGAVAIAVQKVGSQIEAISWMTAEGFSASLSAYIGQNYGARKYDRILKGYKITMTLACSIGLFATLFLFFGRDFLIKVFINEPKAIVMGKDYLMILAISQVFMCMEITTAGAFNGMGRTEIPSFIGIILTGARIPMAMALSAIPFLGLNGVWWSISISSIIKGITLCTIYYFFMKNKKHVIN